MMTPTEVYFVVMGFGLVCTGIFLYYAYGIISYAKLDNIDVE
jgi:hypothetical protein